MLQNKGSKSAFYRIYASKRRSNSQVLPAIYMYDTDNEINNRLNLFGNVRDSVDQGILEDLSRMLYRYNKLVGYFRQAREQLQEDAANELLC